MIDNHNTKKKKNKKDKKHKKHSKSSSSSSSSSSEEENNYFEASGLSSNKYLRSGFVTKVYSILFTQMIFTVFMCALSMSNDHFRMF